MDQAISIDMVDQAGGVLARAASLAQMTMADHQACQQAVQIIAKYVQQAKLAQIPVPKEVPKE